jgi:hypothetical protein
MIASTSGYMNESEQVGNKLKQLGIKKGIN